MCGRYANHVKQMHGWAELLSDWPENAEIGYNIAPTQMVPTFTAERGFAMRWGMVPSWSKEPTSRYATFNARCESVAEKPAFRNAWKQSNTCLIPALGYYEWKGAKGAKQPWFIRPKEETPLVMAGLWERWQDQEQTLLSCTILTQASKGKLETLHSRMPLMLDLEQAEQWLHDGTAVFDRLIAEQHIDTVDFYPVSTAVNKSSTEGETLITPLETTK